jgi:streptomycin 6-kinase
LEAHYGPVAKEWIDTLPERLTEFGARRDFRLLGYHDAGHASVIATATTDQGEPVIIKAWPDPQRYAHETAALRLWYRDEAELVRAVDDDQAMAALVMVGGQPGGRTRPPGESRIVADALHRLHRSQPVRGSLPEFPSSQSYLAEEVLPRIQERAQATRFTELVQRALPWVARRREEPSRTALLHADLYRENIPFSLTGKPIFIDPLPMTGDTCFDWAFWTIYYRVGHRTGDRFRQAVRAAGLPKESLLPWCVLMTLDGLLYYEATEDPRLPVMANTLSILVRHAERSRK